MLVNDVLLEEGHLGVPWLNSLNIEYSVGGIICGDRMSQTSICSPCFSPIGFWILLNLLVKWPVTVASGFKLLSGRELSY